MRLQYGLGVLAVVGLCVLATLPAAQADEPAKPQQPVKDVGSLPEVQDVIFFTEKRPVLLRMRLFNDDKPASERWDEFQKKLFDYIDSDSDGILTKTELVRAPDASTLLQFFGGNPYFGGRGVGTSAALPPTMDEVDADKDGKITAAELANYYRRLNAGPYNAITGTGRGAAADQLTNALFANLDGNKDGKLSKEELNGADNFLLKFDDNDDELITTQELLTTAANPYGYAPPALPMTQPTSIEASSILLVAKEEGKNRLTQRLKLAKDVLSKYDKNKDGKLSPEEFAVPKEVFDALDVNKDGALTHVEYRGESDVGGVLKWVVATPDVEFTVRLGRVEENQKPIEAANDGKGRGGLQLKPTSATTLAMSLGGSDVSVLRGDIANRANPQAVQRQFQFILQQFKNLDKDGKGTLTLKQVDTPQTQFLKTIFVLADRNVDEKLTEKEIQGYLDLIVAASGCQVSVSFTDNGQGLFDMLDSNRDGRLSIREMRTTWNRLSMHARANDSSLAKAEIPRQYQLMVGGAQYGVPGMVQVFRPGMVQPPLTTVPQRGPLWFRKMDVNSDGDVSEREFLGPREDFRRINTTGDGLISVEEAEKADALMRQRLQSR